MNKYLKISFTLVIVLLLGLSLVGCIDTEKLLEDTKIEDVDLNKVEDGIYKGGHSTDVVEVVVEVRVKDHQIKNIELLKHDNWKGKEAEKITGLVLNNQTLEVDSVSGATVSSKIILKAIENALRKGIK